MSRHNRNVPTSFYRRFALDAVSFARQHAAGKCLAVLEGGYSDRALASASAAFLSGFAEPDSDPGSSRRRSDRDRSTAFDAGSDRDEWWTEANLKRLEKACSVTKPRRGGPNSSGTTARGPGLLVGADRGATHPHPHPSSAAPWLSRAVEVFAHLEDTAVASSVTPTSRAASLLTPAGPNPNTDPNTPRQLRERRVRQPINYASLADGSSPLPSPTRAASTTLRRPPSFAEARSTKAPVSEPTLPPPPVPPVPPPFGSAREVPSPSASSSSDRAEAPTFALAVPGAAPASDATSPAESRNPVLAGGVPTTAEGLGPSKPAIRFTWKQGGFGGDPRM